MSRPTAEMLALALKSVEASPQSHDPDVRGLVSQSIDLVEDARGMAERLQDVDTHLLDVSQRILLHLGVPIPRPRAREVGRGPDDPAPVARPESDHHRSVVSARMFGVFELSLDGIEIEEWNGSKARAILQQLLMYAPLPVSSDVLMETHWPMSDRVAAKRSLHQAIYSLRRAMKPFVPAAKAGQVVVFEHGHYRFDEDLLIDVDVKRFEGEVARARRALSTDESGSARAAYHRALALYRGDFLEDAMYEEWTFPYREALRTTFLRESSALGRLEFDLGNSDQAIGIGQRMLSVDPCDEEAHRLLIGAFLAQGRRNAAVRQFRTCVIALDEHLGVTPDPKTELLYERITRSRK